MPTTGRPNPPGQQPRPLHPHTPTRRRRPRAGKAAVTVVLAVAGVLASTLPTAQAVSPGSTSRCGGRGVDTTARVRYQSDVAGRCQHLAFCGEAEAGRLQAVGGQDGVDVVPGDQAAGVGEDGRDVAVVAVEHLGQELVPAQVSRQVQRRQRVFSRISRCRRCGRCCRRRTG